MIRLVTRQVYGDHICKIVSDGRDGLVEACRSIHLQTTCQASECLSRYLFSCRSVTEVTAFRLYLGMLSGTFVALVPCSLTGWFSPLLFGGILKLPAFTGVPQP